MKKLLSIILSLCLLVCLLPTAAFADEPLDNVINPVSSQQVQIIAGVPATYQAVFTITFQELWTLPDISDFSYSFPENENEGKDLTGFGITFSFDHDQQYNYFIVECNVTINEYVIPDDYYIVFYYNNDLIRPSSTNETFSVLTVSTPAEDSVTMEDRGRSLSLKSNICINDYAEIIGTGVYDKQYIQSHGGLLVFNTPVTDATGTYEAASQSTSAYIIAGLVAGSGEQEGLYAQQSHGIPSRKYRETSYIRLYLQLTDGSYMYTEVEEYSVAQYCLNRISNSDSQTLINLCQKILDYGDAAVAHFGSN